jgi:membrane protease YdiL (CAAX protease family)
VLLLLMLAPLVVRTTLAWPDFRRNYDGFGPATAGLLVAKAYYQPGFWEELYYRAFLYAALRTRLGVLTAAAASALLFAAVHLDVLGWVLDGNGQAAFNLLAIFALGVSMAVVYEVSDSILPCMVFHGTTVGLPFALRAIGA